MNNQDSFISDIDKKQRERREQAKKDLSNRKPGRVSIGDIEIKQAEDAGNPLQKYKSFGLSKKQELNLIHLNKNQSRKLDARFTSKRRKQEKRKVDTSIFLTIEQYRLLIRLRYKNKNIKVITKSQASKIITELIYKAKAVEDTSNDIDIINFYLNPKTCQRKADARKEHNKRVELKQELDKLKKTPTYKNKSIYEKLPLDI